MEVKIDNTFVYNIVAKSIVLFNSFFYFLFNSLLFFTYRYSLFFNRYYNSSCNPK